ncbi:hypothetical protein [Streptomyces sp. NPDC059862]|uniref:hypothetical protein n=1 Tax=unclassified Streptomyces TaxID=2593676 RepID=UPI003633B2CF
MPALGGRRAAPRRDRQAPHDSAATVASVADALERTGPIERRRDAKDRRAVRLRITEAGWEVVRDTGSAMTDGLTARYAVPDEIDEPALRRYPTTLLDRFEMFSEGDRC